MCKNLVKKFDSIFHVVENFHEVECIERGKDRQDPVVKNIFVTPDRLKVFQ